MTPLPLTSTSTTCAAARADAWSAPSCWRSAAAVFVPMLLESDPKPLGEDVVVKIPPVDERQVRQSPDRQGEVRGSQGGSRPRRRGEGGCREAGAAQERAARVDATKTRARRRTKRAAMRRKPTRRRSRRRSRHRRKRRRRRRSGPSPKPSRRCWARPAKAASPHRPRPQNHRPLRLRRLRPRRCPALRPHRLRQRPRHRLLRRPGRTMPPPVSRCSSPRSPTTRAPTRCEQAQEGRVPGLHGAADDQQGHAVARARRTVSFARGGRGRPRQAEGRGLQRNRRGGEVAARIGAMTAFDVGVLGTSALSMLFAYVRGVTREMIALMSWVLGFFAAVAFSPLVGAMLPDFGGHPVVRYVVAFALILIAALVLGALVAWPLVQRHPQVGTGLRRPLPRGGVRHRARRGPRDGVCALRRPDHASAAGLVAEFRPCPAADGCRARLKPWLPPEWADRLDYSREGRTSPRAPADRKV